MKKTLTLLSIFAFVLLFVTGTQAQIRTLKGDFGNIVRTIEQTADSVTFVADTLTFTDSGGGVANFMDGDSVVVFFTQNRFKIVNNMLSSNYFDYIHVRIGTSSPGMGLGRSDYNGVVTNTALPLQTETGIGYPSTARDIGIRPVYRTYGPIASSTEINGGPATLRQMLSFRIDNPTGSADWIQIRKILFKPNINNLTGLAVPPDTTKDTLRAYLLDGGSHGVGVGNVVGSVNKNLPDGADLAIVRLLPGTTRFLVWVKDSAQAVDAGEYIGSFGDYSRGRYFLGDDGLPFDPANLSHAAFRPGALRSFEGSPDPPVLNPDYGMMVDGLPPERNPLRYTALYQTLAPMWYNQEFDSNPYNVQGDPLYPAINPNPENGLLPPYRPGADNVAHNPYQPGLVSSALDTLRFYDAYGNRTWDRQTQPKLNAIAYTINASTPEDRTVYLKGATSADDTLRQFGQIVYRRLAYTHADVGSNPGGVEDSVRIVATAQAYYLDPANNLQWLQVDPDTSGGFPRERVIGLDGLAVRKQEAYLDEMGVTPQWNIPNRGRTSPGSWFVDGAVDATNPFGFRTPVDPMGIASLPNTGSKIVVRPNIPRSINIMPTDQWKGTADNNYIRLDILVADGYGNTVDDNEKYKFELSRFGQQKNGFPYRVNGIFDSLVNPISPIVVTGGNIDSGRVYVGTSNLGRANRVFRAASGSNNIGPYRVRVRSTYAFNDRGADVNDPNKLDHNPGTGFSHVNIIPDGSPNNNFGIWFGPGTGGGNASPHDWNAGLGVPMGQTTAMDSSDVVWDGTNWAYCTGSQPRIEIIWGRNEALVVGRVGTFQDSVYEHLYLRIVDIFGNPMDIAPYFNASPVKVTVELPDNKKFLPVPTGAKHFYASVSANIANSGAGGIDNPEIVATPSGLLLDAKLYLNPANTALPGIEGDIRVPYDYNVVKFYIKAPQNVSKLSLAGTDVVRLIAHLSVSCGTTNAADFAITSAIAEVSVIPDVVQTIEIFKSWGKPQGTSVPLEGWGPGTVADRIAEAYPVGTPANAADVNEFYKGYFFRSTGAQVAPSTAPNFPSVMEPMGYSDKGIGSFKASAIDLDHDATAPIPMDTIVVSNHVKQVRLVARVLDQYQNPVGGRLVKFFVESETVPVTPPKTQLQDNAQRGGFGQLGTMNVADDTLKRSTIGDTAQAGWVSAYFISGRVGWQIVRIAVTPDTLAFDLSNKGRNLGEGTPVGESVRGFAPRVIIPIYQRSDTTVRVEIFPYAAATTSPIPLPVDTLALQTLENQNGYGDGAVAGYAPQFNAYSANPLCQEIRTTHFGALANTNIRPYIVDSLGLTFTSTTDPRTVTAGRTVTLLAREYDQFNNLVDQSTETEDTARIRFRLWGPNFGGAPAPYNSGAGSIAPCGNWTRDEYGPMRKASYRHTKVSNLVSGVHISQTVMAIALELPTPKLASSTMYVEATGTAVLPQGGIVIAPNISRDTVKVVSVVKNPTRFDILRAGQEFQPMPGTSGGGPGVFALTGPPENRSIDIAARNISLPAGADANKHGLDAQSVDDILISQNYRKNTDPNPVGKYEIVNNDNVPLDRTGQPLFMPDGSFNPQFERHPFSNMPLLQKLDVYNNLNTQTSPVNRYNDINNGTNIPGARRDGTLFDISIAGGGDGIGADIAAGDRRPILLRVTPVWENKHPQDGNPYQVTGQPGQTRTYFARLWSDSCYAFTGTATSLDRTQATRFEFMGTRTDGGNPGFYEPTLDYHGTRMSVSSWTAADFTRAGYPKQVGQALASFRTLFGTATLSGRDQSGKVFGDFNRRCALADFGHEIPGGGQANPSLTFNPGAFLRVIDSTAEQVIDLRVVDPGLGIDDTVSWDQGKMTVVRRSKRQANGLFHLDDTFYELDASDIVGPNRTSSIISDIPFGPSQGRQNGSGAGVQSSLLFYGPANRSMKRHTFVVVPYRIAFLSLFPSSFNTTQKVNDLSTLSPGILPEQADIDTLPRISPTFYNDLYGHGTNNFEIFTRLYGQIKHGQTNDRIPIPPPGPQSPYARPDTIFRDNQYVYAITPYDRYGNMNTRDSMWVELGARFSNDWELDFSSSPSGAQYLINGGGNYFNAKPINFPSSNSTVLREDTLRIYNLAYPGIGNRNDYLGIKPDDKRLHLTVGEASGASIPDGLFPANVVSSRPVWVKMPFAPAPFVLSTAATKNRSLFRLDHIGRCLDSTGKVIDGLAKDILRLVWEPALWSGQDKDKNNPNDTVKYEWYAIIDSIGAGGAYSRTVSLPADNGGVDPSITIDGRSLVDLIFRPGYGPQPNNPDSVVMKIKWFVRAYTKTGLSTYSDTAGVTVRDNPLPTEPLIISINRTPAGPPQAIQPADGATINALNAASPAIGVVWSPSTDMNNTKGDLQGGPFMVYDIPSRSWIKDVSGRTIDTLHYQWVGVVVSTYPAGKGAPIGTTYVKNASGPSTGVSIDPADLSDMFRTFNQDPNSTSADSVKILWRVYVNDFYYNDDNPMEAVNFPYQEGIFPDESAALNPDTGRWSRFSCQPHIIVSNNFKLNLSKLGPGGIEFESQFAGDPDINKLVGEEICFDLIAHDTNGNIVRDWNVVGGATTLKLRNSTANTDTSSQSWNADPDGYSWARLTVNGVPLTYDPVLDEFYVPQGLFVEGKVRVCIKDSKAENGVFIEIMEKNPALVHDKSANMNFSVNQITNYLVEVTPAKGVNPTDPAVYRLRRYEIVVSPRDRYLNVSNAQIDTRFSARFPTEFNTTIPGVSSTFFTGDVFLTGPTNFFLASTFARVKGNQLPQTITAYSATDPMGVYGVTNPYEILDHAPTPFALTDPADNTTIGLQAAAAPELFDWVKAVPQDPYTNIAISRFNVADIGNDVVTYEIHFVDSVSLTRDIKFASDNGGLEAKYTTNDGQLAGIIDQMSGLSTTKAYSVIWFVQATDGLYITPSNPPYQDPAGRPGFRLRLDKQGILDVNNASIPTEYQLSQNYPNPFNPTTSISYALPKSGQVNITVYDLLGTPVKTLVNESKTAGNYSVVWDATNNLGQQVPTGNYIIKMVSGSFTQTRKMTLMK